MPKDVSFTKEGIQRLLLAYPFDKAPDRRIQNK